MPKNAVHLPFGQSQALTLDSVSALESWADKNNRWTTRYTPQDLSERFYTKLSTAQINGLKLVGVACAPMHTDVVANDSAMVCVPFSGAENHSIINGKDYYYRPTEAAVYGPEGRRIGEGGERSVLFIDINKDRLRRTLAAMTDNSSLANLHRPLTLTDLEEVAGLSARALQLQFLKQFGCSPMAWLRDQRLEVANQKLMTDPCISVTQVAIDFCFLSPSRFAAAYKAKFGRLPSDSRKNTR